VRDLDAGDVRRFLEAIRQENARRLRRENERRAKRGEPAREVSPATLAKHLRQLGACLEAAQAEHYAETNAVRELPKGARPRVPKSPPTYYTDHELARLWPELGERPVYAALCKAAVLTGCRFGELAALTWADLDLLGRELHVARTYTAGIGVVPLPKSNEVRTVDLTPQAAALFEAWLVEDRGEGLVFEREDGGHLSNAYALRSVLYPALERAGIPRVGERGRERDFHSFRHTFARIALEHGAEITWVKSSSATRASSSRSTCTAPGRARRRRRRPRSSRRCFRSRVGSSRTRPRRRAFQARLAEAHTVGGEGVLGRCLGLWSISLRSTGRNTDSTCGQTTLAGRRAESGRETEAFRALRLLRAYYPLPQPPAARCVCPRCGSL
jgi:integrase